MDRSDLPTSFPGSQYLHLIRQRLWNGRDVGRAAVMIGAGFSRNAEARSNASMQFPLWRDLATAIGSPLGLRAEQAMKMPMTRLGSEYETSFGRQALDDLLSQTIPWQDYGPGKVHRLLLNLPWADIFTTNYDTLLEDTRQEVIDRKYDLVVSPSDIPSQQRPRIIKLHDSFPSHRPFVFTEEDFRRYPQESSAFVNLVQQSLMENALLLLGFSGDDFNFQAWAGWVRDRLGVGAPAIYLCGLLNLSDTALRYLDSRGIRAIDLAPLFPVSKWPNPDERNNRALEWLLLSLANGRSPKASEWPRNPKPPQLPKPSPGLPDLLAPVTTPTWTLSASHNLSLPNIFKNWKKMHDAYPGWQVCPPEKRQLLWAFDHHVYPYIFQSLESLPAPYNLLLAYTTFIRLNICLMPMFSNGLEAFEKVVESYRPFSEIGYEEGKTDPNMHLLLEESWRIDSAQTELSWDSARNMWVELVFGLMEEARYQQQNEKFERWSQMLFPVIQYQPAWQAHWYCERTLFALSRFDQRKVEENLAAWPESLVVPFWETRRASVLVEIGSLNEAERVATAALTAIRSRLGATTTDLELLSQEGWTLHLLDTIRFARNGRFTGKWSNSERLESLANLGSDIISVLDDTAERALSSRWIPPHEEETVRGFDVNRITRYSRSNNDSFGGLLHAFGLLRTMERGSVPLRCGHVVLRDEGVVKAAEVLFPFAPLSSLSTLIRQNSQKINSVIERLFSRVAVAQLESSEVKSLFDVLLASVKAANKIAGTSNLDIQAGEITFAYNQLTVGIEVLSRLTLKLNSGQAHQTLDLAIELYKSPVFISDHSLHEKLNNLFKRVLFALHPSERVKRVGDLLFLPIWEEQGFHVASPHGVDIWPEPLSPDTVWNNLIVPPNLREKTWAERIQKLITLTREGTDIQRKVASLRLAGLHYLKVLNASERQRFGKALWRQKDEKGLPSGTHFRIHAFRNLPSPSNIQALNVIKNAIINTKVPLLVNTSADNLIFSMSRTDDATSSYLGNLWHLSARLGEDVECGIVWSGDECITIFQHLLTWWDNQKGYLSSSSIVRAHSQAILKDNAQNLLRIVGVILLPSLSRKGKDIQEQLERLVLEMRELGIPIAEPAGLIYQQIGKADEAKAWYWEELLSNVDERVESAVSGILRWRTIASEDELFQVEGLIDHVVDRVAFCILPGLSNVLFSLAFFVSKHSNLLTTEQTTRLTVGLENLELETRLNDVEEKSTYSTLIPNSEKPSFREAASTLAAEVYNRPEYRLNLQSWREKGVIDALPEVREPWLRRAEVANNME